MRFVRRWRQLGLMLAVVSVGVEARADSRVRGVASNVIAAGKTHALLMREGGRAGHVWGADGISTKTAPASLSPFAKVAAGASFSLGIDGFGRLFGWGLNNYHQAGPSGTTPLTTPAQIGSSSTWKWVTAGSTHGLAINAGGVLYAWGQNSDGELGQSNTSTSIASPTVVASSARWISAAAGNQFSLGIRSDGSLWSWGHNANGQLGNGNTTPQHAPVQVSSSLPWVAVAAGESHVVGIKGDGTLWAWGLNDQGQLGCGTCTQQTVPTSVMAGSWIAVSAAGKSSYALRSDGTLWAWGYNNKGQLGIGGSTAQPTPKQVGSGYQYVAAGYDFVVAVTTDGSLWTWGNNASGQLGNGTTTSTPTPARVPDTATAAFRALAPAQILGASSLDGVHVKTSGVLETWGMFSGSLGLGATLSNGVAQTTQSCDTLSQVCWGPVPVLASQPWRRVSASGSLMVGIRSDGTLWAWGGTKSVPTQISTQPWLDIDNAYGALFAIRADGTLWTWDGTYGHALTQLCTTGACAGTTWATVTSGQYVTLAISTNGTLWGWTHVNGATDYGYLLEDTVMDAAPANLIPYGPAGWPTTWLDVAAGLQDTAAIDCNGTLWGWGYDPYGDIGNGTENPDGPPIRTPAQVLTNAVSVSRCSESAIATDAQANLYLWGHNDSGELATGWDAASSEAPIDWVTNAFTGYRPTPRTTDPQASNYQWQPNVAQPVLAIGCGGGTAFVEDALTTVWAAGDNSVGALGISDYVSTRTNVFGQQQAGAMYPDFVSPSAFSASVNNGTAGNVNTGGTWSTSPATQASGQWFQASYSSPVYLSGISLIAASATTYPVSYSVSVSTDGTHFTTVATTSGVGRYMSIMFPVQFAQYVRITLTGASTNAWNITQLEGLY